MGCMNSLHLLLNSKLIFLKDVLQYHSLSFFLFDKRDVGSALAFHAEKKKRFPVLMNISLFLMSPSKLLRDSSYWS